MDQGGLKCSNNGEDGLTYADYSEKREEGAFRSGASGTMSAASVGPQPDHRMQAVTGDVSNGLGSDTPQEELTTAVSASMGLYVEDSDAKAMGNDQKMQQQSRPPGDFTLEENFSRLEASIADLNRSTTSIDSLIGGADPDLFPLKTEDFSPMEREGMDLEQEPYAQIGKDSDVSQKLFNDNTLDLLQDFDLTGSPSDLNEFYVGDETAFLSSLAGDDSLLGDISMVKETKPMVSGSGSRSGNDNNCTPVNGAGKPTQDPSTPPAMVKMEKDSYIQLCTPGVIKQENETRSFCQMSDSPISICGVSTSGGQSFHFGINTSTAVSVQQQDQKPVYNLYPQLASTGEAWSRGQGYGDSNGLQRGNETFSGSSAFPANFISVKLYRPSMDKFEEVKKTASAFLVLTNISSIYKLG